MSPSHEQEGYFFFGKYVYCLRNLAEDLTWIWRTSWGVRIGRDPTFCFFYSCLHSSCSSDWSLESGVSSSVSEILKDQEGDVNVHTSNLKFGKESWKKDRFANKTTEHKIRREPY